MRFDELQGEFLEGAKLKRTFWENILYVQRNDNENVLDVLKMTAFEKDRNYRAVLSSADLTADDWEIVN